MKTKDKKPYIALLRGVMPTGKNRIPKMAELQELLSSEFEGGTHLYPKWKYSVLI